MTFSRLAWMGPARLLRAALCAVLLSGASACERPPAAPAEAGPPNVLLVTVDTLRPDHLSAYGRAVHETPNIDRLAREGALFENAFADCPWTTASMASVLTGTYPTVHGFKSTNVNRLARSNVTLAEVLSGRGYDTAAVIGSFPLDSIYQLDQGFDHYDDTFTTPIWIHPDVEPKHLESEFRSSPEDQAMFAMAKAMNDSRRTDAEVSDAAIAWLREHGGGAPFFLWVHYFGPHSKPDWRVPESERLSQELARYEPDVLENDREVGRLLDALDASGRSDATLVVFHADHGESLGEEGYVGHGQLLNDATMHIPLLLRWPGHVRAGARVRDLVRNVDIFPTVLDAVGVPPPRPLSGSSLLPRVDARDAGAPPGPGPDASALPDGMVYMETYYPAHAAFATPVEVGGRTYEVGTIRRAVRAGRWQLERDEPHPLMDVSNGGKEDLPAAALDAVRDERLVDWTRPGPPVDQSDRHPEIAARLRERLDAEIARERERPAPSEALDVDAETRLRLKSLGYGK